MIHAHKLRSDCLPNETICACSLTRPPAFHRAVDLKFHRVIDEQHAAVIRDIGQNGGILLPRALWLLEQVDVVYAHERPLGHHGHGVDRVSQRLRRAVVGGKAVEVKLARRAVGEFFVASST